MYYGQYGTCDPCHYGYGYPVTGGCGYNNCFALIVVLFILLIIIGASCYYN
nr:YjcZ family sporulation protein [uncultured Bacillus sp.]